MSERDDDLPDVPGSAHDADSEAREARIDALLSLSSTAPASLDANIAARRAAGDRVILPVEDDSAATPGRGSRHAGRTLLLTVGLAAAAALLLFTRGDEGTGSSDPRTPPVLAGTDTPPPVLAGLDSIPRDSATPAEPSAPLAPPPLAPPPLTPPPRDVALGFERTQPPGTSFGARIDAYSRPAIDSVVAAAGRAPGATVEIRYPATSTELSALAERVAQELAAGGVDAARIARLPYGAGVMRADVTITVGTP